MTPLLGLAGPAEAAIAGGMFLLQLLLLVGTAAAVLGLACRSRAAVTAALVLVGLVTLDAPWEGFRPVESDDPDVHSVAAWGRTLSLMWVAAVASAVTAAAWVLCVPRVRAAPAWPRSVAAALLVCGMVWSCGEDTRPPAVDRGFRHADLTAARTRAEVEAVLGPPGRYQRRTSGYSGGSPPGHPQPGPGDVSAEWSDDFVLVEVYFDATGRKTATFLLDSNSGL